MWRMLTSLAGMAILSLSCSADFLWGKDCDDNGRCLDGYVCDPATNSCVRPWEIDGGTDGGNDGDTDPGDGDTDPEDGDTGPGDGDDNCQGLEGARLESLSVSFNDGGNTVTVDPGALVNISIETSVTQAEGCPSCQFLLLSGLSGESFGHLRLHCFDLAKPAICPATTDASVAFQLAAPYTPGSYQIRVIVYKNVNCVHASHVYESTAGQDSTLAGTLIVREPDCEAWQVYLTDVALNGEGPQAVVEAGETISFSAKYFASQMEGCPNCLDQIVVGIENDAQICEDMQIIDGCPEGKTGTISGELTAPQEAGIYYVKYMLIPEYTCEGAEEAYENDPPDRLWTTAVIQAED